MAAIAPREAALPEVMAVTDVGPQAPPTYRLLGGDWRKPREELQPGFPLVLDPATPQIEPLGQGASTGRRAALARWLTRPDHPLTARVLVNRLWQHHFGIGLVATANDFGAQGEPPTHPELLDWLAVEFVARGWSLKAMHRLMVTSATYCQTSRVDRDDPEQSRALTKDRDNKLCWHARRHRLEGETLRDALLHLSGELTPRMFGPSARPKLPDENARYGWKPDPRAADQNRRSIYVFAKRNLRYPLFDAFDLPDLHNSCARRTTTTTAPQALMLFNGEFTLECARRWSGQLLARFPAADRALVARAVRDAWGRQATAEEIDLGLKFLGSQAAQVRMSGVGPESLTLPVGTLPDSELARAAAVVDFCHALCNANEFLYVD
jgi:hypothetical protein